MSGRGRPKDEAREIATIVGDRFYHGTPCRVCSETLRYTNGGKCWRCAVAYNAAQRDASTPQRRRRHHDAEDLVAAVIETTEAIANLGDALVELDTESPAALEAADVARHPWD